MPLKVGTEIRFTEHYIKGLPVADGKRVRGRVGYVKGYRLGATDPIVTFPATGRMKELLYFEVEECNLVIAKDKTDATRGRPITGKAGMENCVIDHPMHDMPRDVRIAKAILEYLAEPDISGNPIRIAFTMYEDDCDVMLELCKSAEWTSWKKWEHMRKTLSVIASRLANWKYLRQFDCRHNQETMEYGEPANWYSYELIYKHRAQLNPTAWPNYKPDWTPAEELSYMLRRVFDYEAKTALQLKA